MRIIKMKGFQMKYLVFSIPLFLFEYFLFTFKTGKTAFSRIDTLLQAYRWPLISMGVFFVCFLFIKLKQTNKSAIFFTLWLGFSWCITSIWTSFHYKNPTLGLFSLCLSMYWLVVGFLLYFDLHRSFLDPEMKWYHGLPRPIPGLKCLLNTGSDPLELSVCRLDQDGAFVFHKNPLVFDRPSFDHTSMKKGVELIFSFRNHEITCRGFLTKLLELRNGAGFRFKNLTPDLSKNLGDFVESIRGEGYAP